MSWCRPMASCWPCCTLPRTIPPSCFFFSSRRRHTRYWRDCSSDVCSSDLLEQERGPLQRGLRGRMDDQWPLSSLDPNLLPLIEFHRTRNQVRVRHVLAHLGVLHDERVHVLLQILQVPGLVVVREDRAEAVAVGVVRIPLLLDLALPEVEAGPAVDDAAASRLDEWEIEPAHPVVLRAGEE